MDRPPKNPDELVRLIDADLLAKENKELLNLRQSISLGAMEMFLLAAVFSFAVGLIVTAIFALPQDNEKLYLFMTLWTVGFIGSIVISIEFLVRKFRVMRRYMELLDRRLQRLEAATKRPEISPPE